MQAYAIKVVFSTQIELGPDPLNEIGDTVNTYEELIIEIINRIGGGHVRGYWV